MKIINIKSGEKYDVYCGRANKTYNLEESIFCNPFPITGYHNREYVINEFKSYFLHKVNNEPEFKQKVLELKGKTLGCWCKKLDEEVPCHCDIIVDYINNIENTQYYKPQKYKLAVIGSRGITQYTPIYKFLDDRIDKIELIVSGGCKNSPDEIAHNWCQVRGKPILIYYPDWNGKGKRAGFDRNRLIIESSDNVVAFWDGTSNGTKNSIDIAKELGKPCKIIKLDD